MTVENVRAAITQLGVFQSDGGAKLDFDLETSHRTLLSNKHKLVVSDASGISGSSQPDLKQESGVYKKLDKLISLIEKNQGGLDRASDLHKLSNLHKLVSQSQTLTDAHRASITGRLEGLDVLSNLADDKAHHKQASWEGSQYAQFAQSVQARTGGKVDNLSEKLLYGETGIKTQSEVLSEVKAGLDLSTPDEKRAHDFLSDLEKKADAGQTVNIPKYYHCTREDGLFGVASEGKIKKLQPKTGTGAPGAWVSTNPQPGAYGQNIYALSARLEYLNSPANLPTHEMMKPSQNENGGTNIGLQQHIYISEQNSQSVTNTALSLVGVDDRLPNFDSKKQYLALTLGNELRFETPEGGEDFAVFKASTVLKLHQLIEASQPSLTTEAWKAV
ncbi:hypothetical protein [Pseudovibrio sp. Ad26]|uniref:hypothetical protein n=1 Tax=Pseudovibrio sp. Ad26 TaxID=989410 RepID=UPI0007AEAEC0|nr:hypothetical protein [Pseudovibrio sp. Ad26]KZL13884.1 hypothetical protein PsAD26_01349 [Pseudovibrio sp. Ad26]